jgi:hypothetical protein
MPPVACTIDAGSSQVRRKFVFIPIDFCPGIVNDTAREYQ